ncbi:RNA 2'-phosphotransferase [Teredinibacter sp. KSP-S5-2]|uniref:RNA 2'-phosphotransferase n=1 Tax=Teredinibacter sp. KSP-S5-2 TaxID=3034506 RepID=UPI0029344749|nr:RNA 2'-phosphotransferase [Teredinibacter sp. KSP-S5-2]WNO10879.1 RNA 2'-phosphotransferase [Teredinibacter sp. KSP-S5-2]
MEDKKLKKGSKFLSYVLRHKPDEIGLELDAQGWALVSDLIVLTKDRKPQLTRKLIEEIVAGCEKQRFTLNDSGNKIRANQGHSIEVDLELAPQEPPEVLYHGTASRYLGEILSKGLVKRNRHHVHLTKDKSTASNVGQRHGKVVILKVDALGMYNSGYSFYVSKNGVWLTDEVPVEFMEVM